jgi:hypothetical protein
LHPADLRLQNSLTRFVGYTQEKLLEFEQSAKNALQPKTSLVRSALGKLPQKGSVCSYVDLWPTGSEATFATTVAKAITEFMSVGGQTVGDSKEVLWQPVIQRDDG